MKNAQKDVIKTTAISPKKLAQMDLRNENAFMNELNNALASGKIRSIQPVAKKEVEKIIEKTHAKEQSHDRGFSL